LSAAPVSDEAEEADDVFEAAESDPGLFALHEVLTNTNSIATDIANTVFQFFAFMIQSSIFYIISNTAGLQCI
jgi:hypothetical protein